MLANYGVEGDTYTLDDAGNPVFTDKILANLTSPSPRPRAAS